MTLTTACRSGWRRVSLSFLLAAVMLLLPPLVRATAHLQDGRDSPSSFRLNRAFDVPQSKWTVSPPDAQCFDCTPVAVSAPSHPLHAAADFEAPLEHQTDRSPDPLRGPPLD